MKKFLIVIGVGILLGLGGFYYVMNKPRPSMETMKVDANVSAVELLAAFKADENTANGQYLNKTVQVYGVVKEASTKENVTTVYLEADDMMSSIICELDKYSKHPRTSFSAGEKVTFKGICSGYLDDVVLDRCLEVK